MSTAARRALALMLLGELGWLGWRASTEGPSPRGTPTPCAVPVAVEGAVATPGVVCLAAGADEDEALRAAGASCRPAAGGPPPAPGDRLVVAEVAGECRLVRGRQTPAALRVLRVRLDLNRATAEELRALPGVGAVLARRIVAHRVAHGPYRAVDDLVRVRGIGSRLIERLGDRITVGEAPASDRARAAAADR